MPSADFYVCYASVTDTLFDYIEQDLQSLATALLDDDDELPAHAQCVALAAPPPTPRRVG